MKTNCEILKEIKELEAQKPTHEQEVRAIEEEGDLSLLNKFDSIQTEINKRQRMLSSRIMKNL